MRGFSLIELIVAMAILGILMSLGIPAFSDWMRNARVRTMAESVLNGLQLARAEAVRRNTTVGFYLVDTTTSACALSTAGPSWIVSVDSPVGQCDVAASDTVAPRIIQSRAGNESGGAATTVAAGQSSVVFNGLGRPTPLPGGNIAINFTDAAGAACVAASGPVRCLRAEISVGGQIRMCDPALPAGDAQGCI
ncbi:MAG: prepilin-type N-terminal cleavage/methylation domain-containing protein [Candidatus Accumulibacter meliphilus]|jgi:type IV fimbrial biogenesis protein FimT|uniref:Type II secretion system protein H n=1 Tax=Candidatus Accumulibacter meliphilus TaxID=2211374 RepID=A0A369XMF0_9PROT|nr:MAG: prepilin-type N-terminal cleavage/methylation domain-containing protein [Candidatus Accumulibacter meliphilus]